MAVKYTPSLSFSFRYNLGENGWNTGYDDNWRILEIVLKSNVISATTTAQPVSPSNGDLYVVPASATGANWSGQDGKLAYYDGAASGGADEWVFVTATEGGEYFAQDEEAFYQYSSGVWAPRLESFKAASSNVTDFLSRNILIGSDNVGVSRTDLNLKVCVWEMPHYDLSQNPTIVCWANCSTTTALLAWGGGSAASNAVTEQRFFAAADNVSGLGTQMSSLKNDGWTHKNGIVKQHTDSGIVASTTQSQGQQVLLADVNEVATVANANDVVTAPDCVSGIDLTVINNGANTLQIFPSSGDNLGSGVDVSITLASGAVAKWISYDSTNWKRVI